MASTIEERLADATRKADEAHKAAYGESGGTPDKPAPTATEGGNNGQGDSNTTAADVDFKHKYQVLKGKYDAEVPRLYKMVSDLSQQVSQVDPVTGRSVLQDEGATVIDLTTVKDEELPADLQEFKGEYPDVFKGMAKMQQVAFGKLKKDGKAPVDKPVSKDTTAPTVKKWDQGMYQVLNARAPKWNEINQNPEFLGWLTIVDRYARKTRGDLMKDAYAAGDIDTVANIFNDWDSFYTEKASSAELNEDIAPPSGSPAVLPPTTITGQVKPVTRAEVEKYYIDVAKGKYAGKEKERVAMETRIEAATIARAIV